MSLPATLATTGRVGAKTIKETRGSRACCEKGVGSRVCCVCCGKGGARDLGECMHRQEPLKAIAREGAGAAFMHPGEQLSICTVPRT
jgi:hypothetical protein